ncbi:MAG: SPFH domain-containing protein [Methanocalculus sp. MSAO_Arc1]|uniref:SPFH domain-containing protein n=1 Tax=Methanocalculus TaxID=71151 RepID=UPI000FF31897|nr:MULTISPECIES: SPFH domain-containing protein [unclassified Methanocalculus]MCP1662865.1 membrane protease subunit (stomatin/prohibitin family) [Methanocalculus sp. AMF5]RQD82079.1 MAG: SPFH domain-containing protein [Methanocalculus sp. MSAO_Arc1]
MVFFRRSKDTGAGSDIKGTEARKLFYWVEEHKGENVMWRLPQNVMWNDNVLVREDEWGIFFRDGKAMQVFDRPDRYALTTQNIAGLQALSATLVGVKQIGEFYWAQKREFRGTFGTSEPLTFRDTDFGVVRIRIFGQFAYKVADPMLLITQFVGTKGMTTSEEIISWLKDQIIMILNDTLGELKTHKQMGILDMPAYLTEIEQLCLSKLGSETSNYGLSITKFSGLNINLPEEVQEAVDKRGAMSALGVNFMQYQSGRAIENIGRGAAEGGGGEGAGFATLGAGMGAGMGMGNVMGQSMAGGGGPAAPFGGGGQQQEAPQQQQTVACVKCGQQISPGTKFCPHCGSPQVQESEPCGSCGASVKKGMKFCPECGAKMDAGPKTCGKCGEELAPGTKFCANCGTPAE